MKKLVKFELSSFLLFLICLFSAGTVLAKNVNYKTYKYGTSQTSMADGYYARPAKVVADENRYLVTMTIRTKHNLSRWPVKVNTINGQSPLKVTKTRHGTDYDYNYSFYADNLDHKISSSISIDVPKVYKADHQISFMFDQNLPALKKTDKTPAQGTISTVKSVHSKRDENEDGQKTKDPEGLISQAKKQSEAVKKEEADLAAQRLKQNQKNRLDNEHNERMFYYVMLGGIICLIILVVACVFFVLSVKNNKRSKNKK